MLYCKEFQNLIKVFLKLIEIILLKGIKCYTEINLREGKALFKNDTVFGDLTGLRVKKVNRTAHVFMGDATSFVDIDNTYTVSIVCLIK